MSRAWTKWTAVAAWPVVAGLATIAMRMLTGAFIAWREAWVPPLYGVCVVGLIGTALIALGHRRSAAVTLSGTHWIFQMAACFCVVLREPGHALATLDFLAVTGAVSLLVIELAPGQASWGRVIRVLAMLTLAGVPPTPGFFARIDVLSALLHAKLPWLAVLAGLGQAVILFVLVDAAMSTRAGALEPAPERAETTAGCQIGRRAEG